MGRKRRLRRFSEIILRHFRGESPESPQESNLQMGGFGRNLEGIYGPRLCNLRFSFFSTPIEMNATLLVSSTMAQSTIFVHSKIPRTLLKLTKKSGLNQKYKKTRKLQIISGIIFGISQESNLCERNLEESRQFIGKRAEN